MDLFDAAAQASDGTPGVLPGAPLAVRMRPASVDEVLGQSHLLGEGAPLRRLLAPTRDHRAAASSVVLWGPPGTGKTTLAYLVARSSGRRFTELSAVSAGVKDVRAVVEDARRRLVTSGEETVLFVDEVHRFSKSQQDALLPSVENQWVTLVAATTENPHFSVVAPLLSRSLLLTLRGLEKEDVRTLLRRAVSSERGLDGAVTLSEGAEEHLLRLAGADARRSLTMLEAAAGAALDRAEHDGTGVVPQITLEDVESSIDVAAVRYDKQGDQHYDVISAFIKSMRGSDVDAALHYLARMIVAGEDPRFIARRVVIAAAEDVGMADPSALQTAVAAAQAVQLLGMPEGRIPLAEAVVHIATAPKSNRSYTALDSAIADVRAGRASGAEGGVPAHLRDAHYAGAKSVGHGVDYVYSHDVPGGVARQTYLPQALADARYYRPTSLGYEARLGANLERVRAALGREPEASRACRAGPAGSRVGGDDDHTGAAGAEAQESAED